MGKTSIEWTDFSFNPWTGCTKVSNACDFCYAESWAKRSGHVTWGEERRRTSASNWQQPIKWDRQAQNEGRRDRVFCASLADVFDNQVPSRWRDDLWHLIEQTPHLDWLLLTKRPQNIPKMLPDVRTGTKPWGNGWANVWLGTTCENQEIWDRNVEVLGRIPAVVHFVSVEPMLGPIDSGNAFDDAIPDGSPYRPIKWVICGGESGPHARPMHPEWARGLRDQCVAAGVPFYFKQWGAWTPGENVQRQAGTITTAEWFSGRWLFNSENLASEGGHRDDEPTVYRVGKKAAGRLLDGREWSKHPALDLDELLARDA
jgi:protein gp37